MLKKILTLMAVFIIIFLTIPISIKAEHVSLQKIIEQANPGSTIYVASGVYDETIVIDKPLTIIGEHGVQFNVTSKEPIFKIVADDVTIQNIKINYTGQSNEAAIFVNSDRNTLRQLEIYSVNTAIYLEDADENVIEQITIFGDGTLPTQQRSRAIDLWEANSNTIHNVEIQHAEDGIYIENGENNTIHSNIVTDSRYGYHLMFTKNSELYDNESYYNISGMMIMGTKGTKAHHNKLLYNQKNVQSLGLLLFDVKDATIEENDIGYNRIGIVVEDAKSNTLKNNDVHHNFIGLQFKRATENQIYHNEFNANVMQGQAEESMDNKTNENYWSDHSGFDITGDGKSDLPYSIDPFYLHLTNIFPPFRLLFQAPGMIFLDKLMHTPLEQQLTDQAPLIESPLDQTVEADNKTESILIISSTLFIMSIGLILLGVKKQ